MGESFVSSRFLLLFHLLLEIDNKQTPNGRATVDEVVVVLV